MLSSHRHPFLSSPSYVPSLRALYGTPTPSQHTTKRSVSPPIPLCVPTPFLSVAFAISFHVVLFSHYPGPCCLRCLPCFRLFPLRVYPPDDNPRFPYLPSCPSPLSSGISECFGNLVCAFFLRLSYVRSGPFPFLSLPGASAILSLSIFSPSFLLFIFAFSPNFSQLHKVSLFFS